MTDRLALRSHGQLLACYYGLPADRENFGMVIGDMIADLMHLADQHSSDAGEDPCDADSVIDAARGHYEAEQDEEDK